MTNQNTNMVPWLRSGVGKTPSDGGCILQVIDWINRNEWTDKPPCVHRVLQVLAIRANDTLGDDERQKLLDLAPRLMNTASDDRVLSVRLAAWCAQQVLPIFEERMLGDERPRVAIEAALACCDDSSYAANAAANAAANTAYAAAVYAAYAAANTAAAYAAAVYGLLVGCIDEYERLTEHQPQTIDWQPVCEVMARV